jgi:hypothetical protein
MSGELTDCLGSEFVVLERLGQTYSTTTAAGSGAAQAPRV